MMAALVASLIFTFNTRRWQLKPPSPNDLDPDAVADRRNFYKVGKWTRDGQRIKEMLFAGNSLAKAQRIFERFIQKLSVFCVDWG